MFTSFRRNSEDFCVAFAMKHLFDYISFYQTQLHIDRGVSKGESDREADFGEDPRNKSIKEGINEQSGLRLVPNLCFDDARHLIRRDHIDA